MPIYGYQCASCGHQKDVLQKLSDAPLTTCPACGAETFSRQVSAPNFQLKGDGWYVTDFRDGNKGGDKKNGKDGSSAGKDGGESGGSSDGDAGKTDGDSAASKTADASPTSKSGADGGSATTSSDKTSGASASGAAS